MGIRSDVAVCMKSELFAKLPEEIHKWMKADSEQIQVHPDGVMFYFGDVKWYVGSDSDIDGLYQWLESTAESDEHLIVTACHDYPESSDGDCGDWQNNPWGVYKEFSVRLSFEETS